MNARRFGACTLLLISFTGNARNQIPSIPAKAPAQPEVPTDPLGRMTPRGTVRGFLTAASKGARETAALYLNTRQQGEAAENLADQLFVVLNRGLRVQLNNISDRPEGSLLYSNEPYKELVGRISTESGDEDITLERIDRKDAGAIWLFSRATLRAIPELYEEISLEDQEYGVLKFLLETKVAYVALFNWLAIIVALPLLYLVGVALNRLLSPLAGRIVRALRKNPDLPNPDVVPNPVRLLLLAFVIRWTLSRIPLPVLTREFWSGMAMVIATVGCIWLIIRAGGWLEGKISVRLGRQNLSGTISLLRFIRAGVNALIAFLALVILLHYFGVRNTGALGGIEIVGIALALAAQKTLENIIAGVSVISDKALRVGDFLRVGSTLGTVTAIGLRSTRIRTLDRTVVNVPNGQIANATLENLSLRDRFWFHHLLAITYETSAAQLRAVLAGILDLLAQRPEVDQNAGKHVRLLRFGISAFEVEIFAYVLARNWPDFLSIQEGLLLHIMDILEGADARIALPSQITYLNAELRGKGDLSRITGNSENVSEPKGEPTKVGHSVSGHLPRTR